jgi:tellurite resistance protein TehA-like permease
MEDFIERHILGLGYLTIFVSALTAFILANFVHPLLIIVAPICFAVYVVLWLYKLIQLYKNKAEAETKPRSFL